MSEKPDRPPMERAWDRLERTIHSSRELLEPLMRSEQAHNLKNVTKILLDAFWETKRECEREMQREREIYPQTKEIN